MKSLPPVGAATERRPVSFAAAMDAPGEVDPGEVDAGDGTGDLTWGQQEVWRQMRQHRSWMPIGGVVRPPPGGTVAAAIDDIRWAMSRYPSMRTRWTLAADRPRQEVFSAGEVTLEVVDAPDDADPVEVALDVWSRYWNTEFDFASEWPVRMALVRHRGTVARRVWMMCHLVTDGTGGRVVMQDLADRANAGSITAPPLAQARWQRSAAGRRQSELALQHWRRAIGRVPSQRFPTPADRPQPRYWQCQLDSLALHLAVRAITVRTGVASASVLLACFAIALARVTGRDWAAIQVTVSNRFRSGLARTVSPVAQPGLLAINVPDTTVDEVVRAARRGALATYKHAYYDPMRRDELLAGLSADRGEPIDLDCYYNDRRMGLREETTTEPPSPEQIRAALSGSTFAWTHRQDYMPYHGLHVNIEGVAGTTRITMPFDTHRVAPAQVEACLRQLQEVAVSAALDPAARTL